MSIGGAGVAVALAGCSLGPGARKTEWAKSIEKLEKQIPDLMTELQIPGVSIAIVRDARIMWSRGFGVGDRSTGVRVDDDTVFSAQSMSKPVFAYRVMKLTELGVLDLDAQGAMVSFYENDPSNNKSFSMPLSDWRLKRS